MKYKLFHRIHDLYTTKSDSDISFEDPRVKADLYYDDLYYGIISATLICILSLFGLISTFAPYSQGSVLRFVNATQVYILVILTDIIFLFLLARRRIHFQASQLKQIRHLLYWFMGINMVLASLTFYTTEQGSSFFFEYILITMIIYLLPNVLMTTQIRNMIINLISVAIVLGSAHHVIATQDMFDIISLHLICCFVNWIRLQNFFSIETHKFTIEQKQDELYHNSRTDELTELLNRTALRDDFPYFIGKPICIAMIDLDFFKKYNDTYGHAYGDTVLTLTGKYLKTIFDRKGEHCYRYGGDEFMVIAEESDADLFYDKLKNFEKRLETRTDEIEINCSIGYCEGMPHSTSELRSLIRVADSYLYRAKSEGTGKIEGSRIDQKTKDAQLLSDENTMLQNLKGLNLDAKSRRDSQTGRNRMNTFFIIMQEWRNKERNIEKEGELVVLYFNLVNFRLINLQYGIANGDEILRAMDFCLAECFPHDVVSNLGGDHFAVLTDTLHMEERTANVFEKIRNIFPNSVECSVGACVWDDHTLDPETICSRAEVAADENRKYLKTNITYYTKELGHHLAISEYVVAHLDEAIQEGWIVVYYQPIVRSLTNKICGVEALARWQDPQYGMLAPSDFIGALEDVRLIWKLDLHVVTQVVRGIANRYQRGIPEIPVSINLSRLDFLYCDIFHEIETIVKTYNIPRRMLHIEVTESLMTSTEKEVLDALQSFRDVGYEIWMDDFGSGYSTLNLLKDYSFDLLKLDMIFLHSRSKRSYEIIASVIEMDKKIGIRTLAEGVETQEQVDFLKKAGCEKMQGYFFGKPLPFDEMLQKSVAKGLSIEDAQQKICYDALGTIDFMTDIALTIVEEQNNTYQVLFMNDPGLILLHQDGFTDLKEWQNYLNDRNNVTMQALFEAGKYTVLSGNIGEVKTVFHGKERLLKYRLLGTYNDTHLYAIHIFDHASSSDELSTKNQMLMNLTYFYPYIFTIDGKDLTIQNTRFTANSTIHSHVYPIKDSHGRYNILLPKIFIEDQSRYDAFIDPITLMERLEKAKAQMLKGVFRTEDGKGQFVWMVHQLLLTPNANSPKILYVIRTMDFYVRSNTSKRMTNLNTKTLIDHIPLPVFWKDTKHKFLDVNPYYMHYFGLDSKKDILGKTDAVMGWHPNDEFYKDMEEQILKSGNVYTNVPGRCIANGVCHDVLMSEWPTYQNGKTTGSMGFFVEETLVCENTKVSEQLESSHEFLTMEQFIDELISYEMDYQLNKRDFGVLYIYIPELLRIAENYDHHTMYRVMHACKDAIVQVVDHKVSITYIGVGKFVVLIPYTSKDELTKYAPAIKEHIDAIRQVEDIPCSLYAKIRIIYANQVKKINQQLMQVVQQNEEIDDTYGTDDKVATTNTFLQTLMHDAPIGCYVLRPDHMVVYWNAEAEKVLGFSAEEMQGRKCVDMPLGCAFTDGKHVSNAHCPATMAFITGKPQSLQMFMRHKDGHDLLIYNTLIPIKDQEDKVVELVSFFIPLVNKDYDQKVIQNIYEIATRDPLSCLPGRKYMEYCLDEAVEIFRRTKQPFAVLYADVNEFHEVNNTYGHSMGDALLRQFGLSLKKNGRKADIFCRWGGDEFVGLLRLQEPGDCEGAAHRFMRLAKKCEVSENGQTISCQTAIGITVVRENDTVQSIIARADSYMYQAKKQKEVKIVTDQNAE